MTIDSTKYFCKRGAVSARLNLVDTPLRSEYYYDGEHGKYYFGARYYDPFFGMWMSPDPASVLFRETYTPLKCRSIIEKDILQRSNVEPVLLKQSFRASAQFANPYTYGGDPINFVDPNGEFAVSAVVIAAVVGAVVYGGKGAYDCADVGGSCDVAVATGAVGGAVVGAASAATGGLATEALGGGFGILVGGAAGGAVGGAGNYTTQSIVYGGFNAGDLWESTWKGAASGAISAGVSYGLNNLGNSFGGSWLNPVTYLRVPMISEGISSSVASMAMAGIEHKDIGKAGLMGLAYGAGTSMMTSVVSLGYDYLGGTLDYGDGSMIMREDEAVAYMRNHPGAVSGSFATDLLSAAIAILSGGGPLSHVRGSDFDGEVIENNSGGVMEYSDPEYGSKNDFRPTLVTTRYASGVNASTPRTAALKNHGYLEEGLCTGATHTINPAYKGGAPNNLIPWQYRHNFSVNIW